MYSSLFAHSCVGGSSALNDLCLIFSKVWSLQLGRNLRNAFSNCARLRPSSTKAILVFSIDPNDGVSLVGAMGRLKQVTSRP